MKKYIFSTLFILLSFLGNTQPPKNKIVKLNTLMAIKHKLPTGTILKDSMIVARNGYELKVSEDKTKVAVMKKVAGSLGIETGSFACGGCTTSGASCSVVITGPIIACLGCGSCAIIVEKGGIKYNVSMARIRL